MSGAFIISLDFELHWGGFEKWPLDSYRTYFLNTRNAIPRMLSLFNAHGIHATWAGVGLLFHDNREQMIGHFPAAKPSYKASNLSAYHYIEQTGIGDSELTDPFHYGMSLIKQIAGTPGQELGSHTFAHYYCNEPGQTTEEFRADLRAAQQAAAVLGKTLRSLVFPRNQFNQEYLKVCRQEGFVVVRDNPGDWFWRVGSTQHESSWKRLNRGADAYIPVGRKNTFTARSVNVQEGLPICLPASRLLRPYRPSELFLNRLKVSRIQNEMRQAARDGEFYHLWWHPHNFGNYPEENLRDLEKILVTFAHCRDEFGMQSLSMGEAADLIISQHGKAEAA